MLRILVLLVFTYTAVAQEAKDPPISKVARVLSFSADGKFLLAGTNDPNERSVICCWSLPEGKLLWKVEQPKGIWAIAPLSEGKIAVSSQQTHALILDLKDGKLISELGNHEKPILGLAAVPKSDLLAPASGSFVHLWNLKTGERDRKLEASGMNLSAVRVSSDGRWLFAFDGRKHVLWDLIKNTTVPGVLEKQGQGNFDLVGTACFLDGDRILTGSNSSRFQVTTLATGREEITYKTDSGAAFGILYAPGSGLIATKYSRAAHVNIFDLNLRDPNKDETAQIQKLLTHFNDDSYDVREQATEAMRRIGSIAVPLLNDAMDSGLSPEVRMRAREIRKQILSQPKWVFREQGGEIAGIAFSPDGKQFAAGTDDGQIRLWDTSTGKVALTLKTPVE